MKMSLFSLVFQGIPELIANVSIVYTFLNLPLKWKSIIPIGIAMGLIAFIIRLMPITPGIHTLLILVVIVSTVRLVEKTPLINTFYAVFFTIAIGALLEFATNQPILMLLNTSFEEVMQNEYLWTLMGIPQVIILFIIALVKNKHNRKSGDSSRC